jgi:hypothetical protein
MHATVDSEEPAPWPVGQPGGAGEAGQAWPGGRPRIGMGRFGAGLGAVGALRARVGSWRVLLDRPLTSYYLLLGITSLLLGLGLVMVQSTASVADLSEQLSPYSDL